MAASSLVFRLHDRGPDLVREVLLERGWEEYDRARREETDWNLYWRGSAFHSSQYHNLLPWQRLNHHPKTAGITRKDCLARNLRRMRATFGSSLYHFSPDAFILPNDYTRFLSQYNKLRLPDGPSVYWICKPADLSRGRGIFIFQDIKDLLYDCSVIVQRYISDPLLISGYKFDLRIYVCVKSFHPLSVYIHQEGLVRFATEKYNLTSLRNLFAHLTNTSINKFGPFYKTEKGRVGQGCKWTMSKFRHFLQSQDVDEVLLWQRINNIVTLTLLTIAHSVPSCPNCVELFGFDILVDVKFKPWLLEVNYSPALTLDCQADITVKKGLISDLIDLMNYTSTDSLREKAFQRHMYKQPCCYSKQPSHVSIPVLTKLKETKFQKKRRRTQIQKLPLLKSLRQPETIDQRQFRLQGLLSEYQSHPPPDDLNKRCVKSGRITSTSASKTPADLKKACAKSGGLIHSTASKTDTKMTLNLTLGPHSNTNMSLVNRQTCPSRVSCLMDRRTGKVSGVTDCDTDTSLIRPRTDTEAERERDISCSIPDTTHRSLGLGRYAESCRLPDIYSGNHRPLRMAMDGTPALNGPHIPPLRVGDFIRTFPFNAATLKASHHKLDVKTVIQEIHKLTVQLASSDKELRTDKEAVKEEETGCDEDFNSLLWGPKEPPLLTQCFRST